MKDHIKDKPPPAKPKPKPAGKRLHIQATGNSSNNSSPIRLPPSKFKTTINGVSDNETNQEEVKQGKKNKGVWQYIKGCGYHFQIQCIYTFVLCTCVLLEYMHPVYYEIS